MIEGALLFPRAMSQTAMLAWTFGECREGQYPADCGGVLTHCKNVAKFHFIVVIFAAYEQDFFKHVPH
ncbi:MAG: hypothetical protein NC548_08470 [Lachnospiraceae bacterium]|nr:hypothetical protein [Lachnospiraceae bacterium]